MALKALNNQADTLGPKKEDSMASNVNRKYFHKNCGAVHRRGAKCEVTT